MKQQKQIGRPFIIFPLITLSTFDFYHPSWSDLTSGVNCILCSASLRCSTLSIAKGCRIAKRFFQMKVEWPNKVKRITACIGMKVFSVSQKHVLLLVSLFKMCFRRRRQLNIQQNLPELPWSVLIINTCNCWDMRVNQCQAPLRRKCKSKSETPGATHWAKMER